MRDTVSSSKLVRLLNDWAPLDAAPAGMDFAERLSLWLNAFDAIGLQAAHQSIRAIDTQAPAKPSEVRPIRRPSPADDFRRVRSALEDLIAQDFADDGNYAPYRERHLRLQHEMEQRIGPLREQVRQAVGRVSPRLRQLAALDAVLEQVLATREQMLLPTAVVLLERRFAQLRASHRQEAAAGEHPDDAGGHEDTGWLRAFREEWRKAVLAELDLRLEPVAGLIDAMGNETKNEP